MAFAGAVLAGGESRRMGRDKARLRVDGEPLWRRQVRVLRASGAEPVVVVLRVGQRALGRGVRHVRDVAVDVGPLAGTQAALTASEAPLVAVLAVDMPAIDAAWFERLRSRCKHGVGALVRHAGDYEPLAAIYPVEALPVIERLLARGERSMQALIRALVRERRMSVLRLRAAERWQLENWNSPGDRRRSRMRSRAA